MPIFLFLNDLAGRNALLDQCARYFFVSGVPILGMICLAQLTILWPQNPRFSRSKTVLALALALLYALLFVLSIAWLQQVLGAGALSPRPFMTRRVNLLVIEPQDNSFPAFEMVLGAIFAFASWQLQRKIGIFSAFIMVLLGATRLFCGANYLADVAFGAVFGVIFGASGFALVRLHKPALRARQAALAFTALSAATLALFVQASGETRFARQLSLAAIVGSQGNKSTAPATMRLNSENTLSDADAANSLLLSKREHHYLPEVERYLMGHLAPLSRPFRLLGVEVAPVRAGDSSYRVAAIRFEIWRDQPNLRAQTANVAARLVKRAFSGDSRLENVDVVAILRGSARDIDGSLLRFVGDEVPVFTASVQRQNLIIAGNAWANSPQIDGGSWLSFRSRLWINERVLPQATTQKIENKARFAGREKL